MSKKIMERIEVLEETIELARIALNALIERLEVLELKEKEQ